MTEEIIIDTNIINPNKFLAASKNSSNARSLEYLPAKPNWFSRLIGWLKGCHPASNLNRIIHNATKIAQATIEHSDISKNHAAILQRNLSYLHTKAENHNKSWLVRLISVFTKKILCSPALLQKLEQQIHELEKIKQNLAAQPQVENTVTPHAIPKISSASIPEQIPAEQVQKEEKAPSDSANAPIENKPNGETAEAITKDISKYLSMDNLLPAMKENLDPKLSLESLIKAGQIQFNLGKFNEAEIYFDQAIKEHKNSVSSEALMLAAEVKYHLKKWAEADELYDDVVEDYKKAYRNKTKDAPSKKTFFNILSKAAYVKTCLKDYSDAVDLFADIVELEYKVGTFDWPAKILNAAATAYYEESKYRAAEEYANLAINSYGEKITPDVLLQASKIKKVLNKHDEAEQLIDQIIALSEADHAITGNIYHEMALAKKEFGKLEEAQKLILKAQSVKPLISSPQIFYDAALIKFDLKNYDFAEQDMILAEIAFEKNIPIDFYYHFGLIKKELNKLDEAEEFYKKALQAYGYITVLNVELLKDAAELKFKLKKYADAGLLYDQARTQALYKNQKLSAQNLFNAAFSKFQLKKYKEAELYINQAEVAYGNQVPANFYFIAASIKYALNKYLEADKSIAKAMKEVGEKISPDILHTAFMIKIHLQDWSAAELLNEKIIAAYSQSKKSLPQHFLPNSLFLKIKFKKYEEAESLYEQAVTAFGTSVSILCNGAQAKMGLMKYEEAETLFEKVEIAANTNFLANTNDLLLLYSSLLEVKNRLNKFSDAEAISEKLFAIPGYKAQPSSLYYAAAAKYNLKKLAEAEVLIDQAIADQSFPATFEILHAAYAIKKSLGKLAESKSFHSKAVIAHSEKVPENYAALFTNKSSDPTG